MLEKVVMCLFQVAAAPQRRVGPCRSQVLARRQRAQAELSSSSLVKQMVERVGHCFFSPACPLKELLGVLKCVQAPAPQALPVMFSSKPGLLTLRPRLEAEWRYGVVRGCHSPLSTVETAETYCYMAVQLCLRMAVRWEGLFSFLEGQQKQVMGGFFLSLAGPRLGVTLAQCLLLLLTLHLGNRGLWPLQAAIRPEASLDLWS